MVLSVMRQHGLWAAVSVFLLLVITGKNASAKADIILNNTAIYDNSACLTLVGKLVVYLQPAAKYKRPT